MKHVYALAFLFLSLVFTSNSFATPAAAAKKPNIDFNYDGPFDIVISVIGNLTSFIPNDSANTDKKLGAFILAKADIRYDSNADNIFDSHKGEFLFSLFDQNQNLIEQCLESAKLVAVSPGDLTLDISGDGFSALDGSSPLAVTFKSLESCTLTHKKSYKSFKEK